AMLMSPRGHVVPSTAITTGSYSASPAVRWSSSPGTRVGVEVWSPTRRCAAGASRSTGIAIPIRRWREKRARFEMRSIGQDGGRLHPTRNLEQPIDPTLNWATHISIDHQIERALTLSMGFGGINTALCWERQR